MPTGVASHFLAILAADRRAAGKKVMVGALVAAALMGAAFLLGSDPAWQAAAVTAAGLVAGAIFGFILARTKVHTYEESIRGTWTQWMRYAVAAESVPEIHRKVRGKSGRNLPFLYAFVLLVLWGSEIALVVLALAAAQSAGLAVTAPVLVLNGMLAGGMIAYFLVIRKWTSTFSRSVTELVDSGEVNVWGLV